MRVDLGLVLGILFEYILIIYYANTTFYPKDNYYKSSIIAFIGYALFFVIVTFGYVLWSVIAFFVINFIIFVTCYDVGYKNAAFQSGMFDILSIIGECLVLIILRKNINIYDSFQISPSQSLLLTIISKMIYCMGVFIMIRLVKEKGRKVDETTILPIVIPVITIVCLMIIANANIPYYSFLALCILLLIINIAIFAINEISNSHNKKLQLLKAENEKNKFAVDNYKILSEKYEQTRIMRHDFKEQINSVKRLVAVDNVQAQSYLNSMSCALKELNFIEYTDNNILNILLMRKMEECHQYNIEININSTYPPLSFLSEIDTVAIFSNLIDNAIEGCNKSKKKNIFIDLSTVNKSFIVIKIENNSDIEPKTINNQLVTQKDSKDTHGIGMKSAKGSIKKYNGDLEWHYDKENKIFRTIVMLKVNMNCD